MPAPSNHVSRPSFDTLKEMMMAMVVEAPKNHAQAKTNVSAFDHVFSAAFKYFLFKALVRDGFRCVVSGLPDMPSLKVNEQLKEEMISEGRFCTSECAHIFPVSTNMNISGNEQANKVRFLPTYKSFYLSPGQLHYAASVWAVLDRFGYKKILTELNGSKIHSLKNVFTLSPDVHILFDTLQFWLEPVEGAAVSNFYLQVCQFEFNLVSRIPTNPQ